MITIEQKLANIETNKNRFNALLARTNFTLIHYSQGTPIIRNSPNPHAYVVLDKKRNIVIPGLMVFLAFSTDKIACLECWKTFKDTSQRVKLDCDSESDKAKVIKFIHSKHRGAVRYLRNHGILAK
jgi:hypothetical protein